MRIRLCSALFLSIIIVTWAFILFFWRSDSKKRERLDHFKLMHKPWPVVYDDDIADSPQAAGSGNNNGKSLEELALNIFRKHNLVLVSVINRAYLPFASSWLCNTEPFGIHKQVLIFTTDAESRLSLQHRWPGVTIVSLNVSSLSEDQAYREAGYVRVTVERARCINRLLNIGVRILLFEFDCTWLANPVPTVLEYQQHGDIVATKVGRDRKAMASGFLLLNPTPATTQVWNQFTEKMEEIWNQLSHLSNSAIVEESILDQFVLWRLVRDEYAGVKVVYLPRETFADGEWYKQPRYIREESPRPIIINNNFIQGNAKKIKRARKFGHWFLDADLRGDVCDKDAVNDIVNDGA